MTSGHLDVGKGAGSWRMTGSGLFIEGCRFGENAVSRSCPVSRFCLSRLAPGFQETLPLGARHTQAEVDTWCPGGPAQGDGCCESRVGL